MNILFWSSVCKSCVLDMANNGYDAYEDEYDGNEDAYESNAGHNDNINYGSIDNANDYEVNCDWSFFHFDGYENECNGLYGDEAEDEGDELYGNKVEHKGDGFYYAEDVSKDEGHEFFWQWRCFWRWRRRKGWYTC